VEPPNKEKQRCGRRQSVRLRLGVFVSEQQQAADQGRASNRAGEIGTELFRELDAVELANHYYERAQRDRARDR